jgi:hypothetical protein
MDPLAGTEWLATGEPVSPTERPLHALNIVATATQPSTDLDVRTRYLPDVLTLHQAATLHAVWRRPAFG